MLNIKQRVNQIKVLNLPLNGSGFVSMGTLKINDLHILVSSEFGFDTCFDTGFLEVILTKNIFPQFSCSGAVNDLKHRDANKCFFKGYTTCYITIR